VTGVVVGEAPRNSGTAPWVVSWSLRRRRTVWLASVFGGGSAIGPLTNAMVRKLAPALAQSWSWLTLAGALVVGAILAAGWTGLALLTEDLFGLSPRRCWPLAAAVCGLGSAPWLVPLSVSLPAHCGLEFDVAVWMLMTVPFVLVAALVCPGVRVLHRLAVLLACVGVATAWPALSTGLVHQAAAADRAALGAPTAMYLLVDLPGYVPFPYTYVHGVLEADYDTPGWSSPMKDSDDLVLTVCPLDDPIGCSWGEASIKMEYGSLSCAQESADRWRCIAPDGSTTLAARYGDLYAALTVDPSSDTPIAATRLDAIIKTLHRIDDRGLVNVMNQ